MVNGYRPRRRLVERFVAQAILFELGLALLAIALGACLGRPPLETYTPSPKAVVQALLATMPMLALFFASRQIAWRGFKETSDVMDNFVVPLFARCSALEVAVICMLAGLGEEMLFRAVLQGAATDLGQRWGAGLLAAEVWPWAAAGVVAVLFGLLHAITRVYAAIALVVGFYLGAAWIVTGNIAVPIGAHALYDLIVIGYLIERSRHQH